MLSISNVAFSVWDASSILASSVVEVKTIEDLSSPLLGVVFSGQCPTCFQTKHKCPGHWGAIRLANPVYHVSWISHTLRLLKKEEGKFTWDKGRACIMRDGELFPAHMMYDIMDNPPVISVLPVPPPHVRPSLYVNGQVRGENDLTYRLQNIVRRNTKLADAIQYEKPMAVIDQAREALQNAVTGYINHEKLGYSRQVRNKREYSSCTSRIRSKNGRVRNNLMGKRVEFTARCVITGDDSLKLTEVGVPQKVARILTVPVKCTDYNKKSLESMMEAGNVKYITNKDGSRTSKCTQIEVGDVAERFLKDGDIVLFNRQPSLHKYSLMGHYVRILPGDTFRINVACTSPYNADFDGDECNIHCLQTVEARAEAEEVMCVKHNIVSAQANQPVIGLIQDSLLGCYLLSGDTLSRAEAMQIAQCPTGVSGREIISTILPPLDYERGGVKIENGVFLEGRLTKRDVGKSGGSLVQIIFNDFGADACVDFMHALQGIAHRYLQIRGFTIGVKDLIRSAEATLVCEDERKRAFEDALKLKNPNPRLNSCRAVMGRAVMEGMGDSNSFYCMVASGSKGSLINISQVQGCLGQMNVQGGRTPFQWGDRTSTEFDHGDNTPLSRGFVSHSYLEGLAPFEMFAHSMSGREGLIDTAIKTAQTGYTERKLMKTLENVVTHVDGTVRDGDRVISFMYGDDGFDGSRIETQRVSPLKGARPEDLALLGEKEHFPVPIHRIVRKMRRFGRVGHRCGHRVSTGNVKLDAFINVHTPEMDPSVRLRFDQEVEKYIAKAKISQGEGVGALAAQSIGERTTQCTLNSVDYNEWIVIRGYPGCSCIGKVVDTIMEIHGYDTERGTHVTEVNGMQALTISEWGHVSWKPITHVTRHPPRKVNGDKSLIKVTTESGRTVIASRAKSFLVIRDGRVVDCNAEELNIGDEMPLLRLPKTRKSGWHMIAGFLGAFYGCGRLSGNRIYIPERVSNEFTRYVVAEYKARKVKHGEFVVFESDRLSLLIRNIGNFPLPLLTSSLWAMKRFCRAFIECRGIKVDFVCVPCETPLKDGVALVLHSLGVKCTLSDRGLLIEHSEYDKLRNAQMEEGYVGDPIVKMESVESSHKYLYDITVKGTKNMCTLGGLGIRDTFHFAGIGSKNVTLGIPRLNEILGVAKRLKTPLTTVKDRKALKLKFVDLKKLRVKELRTDSVGNYWEFPDRGITEAEALDRWGIPSRIVLKTDDIEIARLFEYAAYALKNGRLTIDVFGDVPDTLGVKGAEWCKWVNGHVETTLEDIHKIMEICDNTRSLYTNDIYKMSKIYGIEAARSCLIIEIRKIMDHYGIYVNSRHLLLLVDTMTFCGALTPLTRHGLKRANASALKRCTFEEVVTVLHEAALKGEVDPVDGVSPCILTGKTASLGSNTVTVMKDHIVEKQYKVEPPEEEWADDWVPQPMPFHENVPYRPPSPTYMP